MYERLRPPVPRRIDTVAAGGGLGKPRVLLLGVYMADEPNNVVAISQRLADSTRYQVTQSWAALGLRKGPPQVREVTTIEVAERAGKYELLSRLLERADLESYDYLVICDDDIHMPEDFLDRFLALQAWLGFALAQPARTRGSYINHQIVEQQPRLVARQTRFVESGPVVSAHRSVFDLILPFDLSSPMGWGYENIWAYRLSQAGFNMGIIDATAVDHSLRAPTALYSAGKAYEALIQLHEAHAHLPLEDCYSILAVIGEGAVV